jgi:hypothetical protein
MEMRLVLLLPPFVKRVVPVPLQILEPVMGQKRVPFVLLVFIRYLPTLHHVRPVPPLPTPPLSNAPLVPIKTLQHVTQDIMDLLVIHLVKHVGLVLLQILEQVLGQQRVLFVPLVCILCLRTLKRAPRAVLVPLQILEQKPGQQRVLFVSLVRIHCLRTLLRVQTVQEINILPLAALRAKIAQLGSRLCLVHQIAKTFEMILDAPEANIQKKAANQLYHFIVQLVLRENFLTIKVKRCIRVVVDVQVEDIQRK